MIKIEKFVGERLGDVVLDCGLTAAQAETLSSKKHVLLALMRQVCSQPDVTEDEVYKEFKEACRYALVNDTFLFKQAMVENGYTSKEEFYHEVWRKPQTVEWHGNEIPVCVSGVYRICSSPEFLDMHFNVKACDVLKDAEGLPDGVFQTFVEIGKSLKEIPSDVELKGAPGEEPGVFSSESSIFDRILPADSFKAQKVEQQCQEVLSAVLKEVYAQFREKMFKLETFKRFLECEVVTEACSVEIEQMLMERMNKLAFNVHINREGGQMVCSVSPFRQYDTNGVECSERELTERLRKAKTGIDFSSIYYVGKNVLAPKLTASIVEETVNALENARVKDDFVKVKKRKTVLPVYENFYDVLRQKQFRVEDKEDYFMVRW